MPRRKERPNLEAIESAENLYSFLQREQELLSNEIFDLRVQYNEDRRRLVKACHRTGRFNLSFRLESRKNPRHGFPSYTLSWAFYWNPNNDPEAIVIEESKSTRSARLATMHTHPLNSKVNVYMYRDFQRALKRRPRWQVDLPWAYEQQLSVIRDIFVYHNHLVRLVSNVPTYPPIPEGSPFNVNTTVKDLDRLREEYEALKKAV